MIPDSIQPEAWASWAFWALQAMIWPLAPVTIWPWFATWNARMEILAVFGVVYGGLVALGLFPVSWWVAPVPFILSFALFLAVRVRSRRAEEKRPA